MGTSSHAYICLERRRFGLQPQLLHTRELRPLRVRVASSVGSRGAENVWGMKAGSCESLSTAT
eukprot:6200198-Pleurochrysis_carterae.AAC.5